MKDAIQTGKQLIAMISALFNQSEFKANSDILVNDLYRLAKFHSLEGLVADVLTHANIEISEDLSHTIHKAKQIAIVREATQEIEKHLILETLEKNQIKHLVLKGSVLKYDYPSPEMRSMADIDILVEKSNLKHITPLMRNLGYEVKHKGGNHDVYHKLPFMNIEIHHAMIDASYQMGHYYDFIWDKIVDVIGKTYQKKLTDEEYFIYMMAHFAKHYSVGGSGIRSVLDIWIYLRKRMNTLNWDLINDALKQLRIEQFTHQMIALANGWFNNQPIIEDLIPIEAFIIESGVYGTTHHASISNWFVNESEAPNLKSSKRQYVIRRIFPPYSLMIRRNPIIQKCPPLILWFWMTRLLKGVFFHRKRIGQELTNINQINQDDIKKVKDVHKKSGI